MPDRRFGGQYRHEGRWHNPSRAQLAYLQTCAAGVTVFDRQTFLYLASW